MSEIDESAKPCVIFALQGGGALGAFQLGAYKALAEPDSTGQPRYSPDWVTGISIGSINAAIIAGNWPQNRLPKLQEFWDKVGGASPWWDRVPNYAEKLTNLWSFSLSGVNGVPGFFRPNKTPPFLAPVGSASAVSLYSTEELKGTLSRLIDFDYINHEHEGSVRLSLGATKVFGGSVRTFDNFTEGEKLGVDHVMASGALPPAFPGVMINGELYWDGGVVSNSSFPFIIENVPLDRHVLIFVVDLWGAYNRDPKTMDEVSWHVKQIQYSSGIEHDMNVAKMMLDKRRLEAEKGAITPEESDDTAGSKRGKRSRRGAGTSDPFFAQRLKPKKKSDRWKETGAGPNAGHIDIIRISYRSYPDEIPYGDGLFTKAIIQRRIEDGYAATKKVLLQIPGQQRDHDEFTLDQSSRGKRIVRAMGLEAVQTESLAPQAERGPPSMAAPPPRPDDGDGSTQVHLY